MSSSFKRIYPGKARLLFDGGLNTKYEPSIIEDNESPDCKNVVFTNGAVETRQGCIKLNTTPVGSFSFDGVYSRRADDGSETMCVFAGGTMWTLAGTAFTSHASATSFFTAGVRVSATQAENYLFIGNGYVIPHKWNGAEFTRHGIYPPTTTHTVASSASGVLTGDYRYKITCVNSNAVESDVGPVSATFTAASATLGLTSIPTFAPSFGVTARRVYRTEAGGATFKRVTEIANNTATTYSDNNADAALGVAAPTDNGVPPLYSVCVYHQNRLWVNDLANPNYVWYSNLADPYTFASTNFIKVGDNTSDLVKTLAVWDNSIIIGCENSHWMVYMQDSTPANWNILKTKSPYGCKSPFSTVNYNNKMLFAAVQNTKLVGFAAMVGDSLESTPSATYNFTASSDLKTDKIETDIFDIQETYINNISSIVYKNRAYITCTYGTGSTYNNRIYVLDFSTSNISKHQKESWVPWTGLNASQFVIYNGNLYYGSSTATGFIYKLEGGTYSDDGAAIDSYYWTKELSGGESELNYFKDFRYANVLVDNAGAWKMNISYRVDSDKGSGDYQQLDLNPGSSLWGTMVWGRDTWGGGTYQKEVRLFLGGARGKRIQFKFSNQNVANQSFKVHGLNLHYNIKGMR